MEVAKKEIERAKSIEEDLEKAIDQGQQFKDAVDILEGENDALEAEISQLKKEASKREEKRQSLIRKGQFDLTEQEDTTTMQEMAGNYYEMSGQMETLKTSIRYLRAENSHLKSLDFVRSLDLNLDPTREDNKLDDHLKSLARETRVLVKDLRVTGASPRVIQLSNRQNTNKDSTPDYRYQTQQSVLHTLKQRSIQLRNQMNGLNNFSNTQSKVNRHAKTIKVLSV